MPNFREWRQQATRTAQGLLHRAEQLAGSVGETVKAVEFQGIRAAAQIAWHPAGFLLEVYHMPALLNLSSQREAQILQALTAAELGRQVHEPVLRYFIDQLGTAPKALPSPGNDSTAVIPYTPDRRTGTADMALNITAGVSVHFIRSASARFEDLLPEIIQHDEGIDPAEKERLLQQIPLLMDVARQFVGQVATDAQGLLTSTDERVTQRIITGHAAAIRTIAQEYRERVGR